MEHSDRFNSDPFKLETTKRQLDPIRFRFDSDCGRVCAEMSAGSGLRGLSIKPGAKAHLDHTALAQLMTLTVKEYEKETGEDLKEDAEVHVSGGFGNAPWAAPMCNDWNEVTTYRLKEVDSVRKELVFLGAAVGAAGESYADLDFENGRFIDATGKPIE